MSLYEEVAELILNPVYRNVIDLHVLRSIYAEAAVDENIHPTVVSWVGELLMGRESCRTGLLFN